MQVVTAKDNGTYYMLVDKINSHLLKGFKTAAVAPVVAARQSPVPSQQQMHSIKAPSTIKTNIKAANTAHPYQR